MADKKTILDFIRHFKDAEFTFLNGCCYWFCYILTARFGGITLYEPVEGHFIQKIGDAFYDVRGEVTDKYINNEKLLCWESYESVDSLHYSHIVRDCIMKERYKDDKFN